MKRKKKSYTTKWKKNTHTQEKKIVKTNIQQAKFTNIINTQFTGKFYQLSAINRIRSISIQQERAHKTHSHSNYTQTQNTQT